MKLKIGAHKYNTILVEDLREDDNSIWGKYCPLESNILVNTNIIENKEELFKLLRNYKNTFF